MQNLKQLLLLALTVSASGISFITSLIIAKIYQTTEFGEFAYYFAIATILSGFLSLRIDTTSLVHSELNGTDKKIIFAATLITLPAVALFGDSNAILTLILASSMAVFTSNAYDLIPKNKQTLIGVFKLALATTILAGQILINYLDISSNKLLMGATLANVVVSVIFTIASKNKKSAKVTFLNEVRKVLRKRIEILKNLTAWFIETAIAFTPIIIITAKFNPHSAGLFAFSEKLFRAPTAIIISSVIPFAINKLMHSSQTIPTIKKYWLGSFILTSPLLLTPVIAKPLISSAWGSEWIEAAQICTILFPLFILQTIVGGTNFIFNKTNKLNLYSILQAFHLGAIYLAITLPDTLSNSLKLYAATSVTFYLLLAILQIKLGRNHDKVDTHQSVL